MPTYPELAGLVCFFDDLGLAGTCYTTEHFAEALAFGILFVFVAMQIPGVFEALIDFIQSRTRLTGTGSSGCADAPE